MIAFYAYQKKRSILYTEGHLKYFDCLNNNRDEEQMDKVYKNLLRTMDLDRTSLLKLNKSSKDAEFFLKRQFYDPSKTPVF